MDLAADGAAGLLLLPGHAEDFGGDPRHGEPGNLLVEPSHHPVRAVGLGGEARLAWGVHLRRVRLPVPAVVLRRANGLPLLYGADDAVHGAGRRLRAEGSVRGA